LKSEKNQKAQNDNEDKLNTLLEHAQKKIETQIAQSQQIFEQVTNKFLDRITAAQQSAPTANHDNEVTKQLGGGGGVRGQVGGRCEENGQTDG
jgi:hypothetical protein